MIRIRYPSNFSRKRWKLTAEPVFGAVVKLTREVSRLGITHANVKLKGIDGDPHKRWSMWFNSMQREEPYLPLTYSELARDGLVPSGTEIQVLHGCRQLVS